MLLDHQPDSYWNTLMEQKLKSGHRVKMCHLSFGNALLGPWEMDTRFGNAQKDLSKVSNMLDHKFGHDEINHLWKWMRNQSKDLQKSQMWFDTLLDTFKIQPLVQRMQEKYEIPKFVLQPKRWSIRIWDQMKALSVNPKKNPISNSSQGRC